MIGLAINLTHHTVIVTFRRDLYFLRTTRSIPTDQPRMSQEKSRQFLLDSLLEENDDLTRRDPRTWHQLIWYSVADHRLVAT